MVCFEHVSRHVFIIFIHTLIFIVEHFKQVSSSIVYLMLGQKKREKIKHDPKAQG